MPIGGAMKMLAWVVIGCFSMLALATPVTPPGYGSLLLTGTPATGQPTSAAIYFCKKDPKNSVERGSCLKMSGAAVLGTPVALSDQLKYFVVYDGSRMWVEIKAGQTTTVNLGTISVPATDLEFIAFVDYKSHAEQVKDISHFWGWAHPPGFEELACKHYPDVCAALALSEHAFYEQVVRINDKAEHQTIELQQNGSPAKWRNGGRTVVHRRTSNPTADAHILVLPGTYGVSFYDTKLGLYSDQYGIVVP